MGKSNMPARESISLPTRRYPNGEQFVIVNEGRTTECIVKVDDDDNDWGKKLMSVARTATEFAAECNPQDCYTCSPDQPFPDSDLLDERIDTIFDDLADLRHRKRQDYGNGNLYASEALGVAPWLGVLVRLSDKWERVKNLVERMSEGKEVNFESFNDTLDDIANYAVICKALREEAGL